MVEFSELGLVLVGMVFGALLVICCALGFLLRLPSREDYKHIADSNLEAHNRISQRYSDILAVRNMTVALEDRVARIEKQERNREHG